MRIADHIKSIDNYILNNLQTTKESLHDWETNRYLMDGRTVTKFWDEVEKAPAIRIIGDYDVDGILASFIMAKSIKLVFKDKPVKVRLPRRFTEGYGINKTIVKEIYQTDEKGTLIITVDNGIAASSLLEELQQAGYPVIVTDHHELGANKIPDVEMVLDPSVPECASSFTGTYWCGAAVAYKLSEQMLSESNAKEMETYAGVATIADVVPLKEGNWGLVKKALNAFRRGESPQPLTAIISMLGKELNFTDTSTLSFYLCPTLNAPGRLYDTGASKVLSYLFTPTIDKAKWLLEINEQRKRLRDEQTERVIEAIYERNLEDKCPIWIDLPDLHEGIIGIIASNITEKFHVPAIILNERPDGTLKGSARTYGDINIFDYLLNCKANYIGIGGHEGAAGLTISREEYENAKLHQVLKPRKEEFNIFIEQTEIPELFDELKYFEPFGQGNPDPKFSTLIDINTDNARLVGTEKNHLIINKNSFKITHFHHEPNDLRNKNKFILSGTISGSNFKGIETPTLDGKEVLEYEQVENEVELWK